MSLLNHNTPTPNNIAQLKEAYNMVSNSSNPRAMLNYLAKTNPNLAMAMQICNGQNPKDIFYEMCKQRGVNPDDILNQLK